MQSINSLLLSVCLSVTVVVIVSVMNAACYSDVVKYQLVHEFLVCEC